MRLTLRSGSVTAAAAAVLLAGMAAPPAAAAPPAGTPVPHTLSHTVPAGDDAVVPGFPIDFVAVTWNGDHGEAQVRLRHGGGWSPWQPMGEDGAQEPGSFGSALVPAGDATAYQVRVPGGVGRPESVAINTTDGPSAAVTTEADPVTAPMGTVQYVPRSSWGANEDLRFADDGTETWPSQYSPVQKLTVHHTATDNADPDPMATVRAIYAYHTVNRGWGDIGYQFLVDEAGRIYEGRHTDDDPATAPGFGTGGNAAAGVTGAHVEGWNTGNIGVSMLGTLTDRRPTAAAQRAVEQVLAELANRTGIDPTASGTYVNPVSQQTWTGPNVPGHRDFTATECPGGVAHALLPTVRTRVQDRITAIGSPMAYEEDTTIATPTAVTATTSGTRATITWQTAEVADSQVQYWPRNRPGSVATTALDLGFVTGHSVPLSGLRKRTTYEYRVISADKAGNRTESPVGTFTIR